MQKIEGLYTAITSIIKEREDENRLAMDVDDIVEAVKEEVDVYSASLDWYIRFALRAAVEVGLYSNGYRSVVKGEGMFVKPSNCDNPAYLARLFNNARLSEEQKKRVVAMMKKAITDAGVEGQLIFDFEEETIVEEITEKQLLKMLEMDAKAV